MESPHEPPIESPDPATLPKGWDRTVYNLFYRVLGNRKLAKRLTRKLADVGPCAARPITLQARELARMELPPEEFDRTLFARGRDILSQPPDPEDLPRLGAGFDSTMLEKELKDVLPAGHRVVIELLFVDRRPLAEVSELFGVQPDFLVTCLAQLIDLLSSVTEIVHEPEKPEWPKGQGWAAPQDAAAREAPPRPTCPHPLTTIRSRIQRWLARASQPSATRDAESACPACRDVVNLVDDVLELFARDSRILSLSDDRMIKRAMEGPRVKLPETPPVYPASGPQMPVDHPKTTAEEGVSPPLPTPNTAAWKLTGAVIAVVIFYAAYSAFSVPTTGGDTDQAGFHKGLKALKKDSLGTYSDLTSPARELVSHTTLTAGPRSPLYLTYHTGIQVELSPSSSATVQANRVRLNRGRLRLKTQDGAQAGFFITVGDLVARIKEGEVFAAMTDGSPVRFSLKTGILDVKDAKNRRYRLEPSNVMKVASTGNGAYTVEETTAEDLADAQTKDREAATTGPTPDGLPSAQ
ncbi:MAG: hypothetical protein HY815_27100 [Candidatus Riflebacteria bacterium]|nr:hypothetical protein [Candidatus Riflebacteria bacterium]